MSMEKHARADMCAMARQEDERGKDDGGDFSTESKEEKIRAVPMRRGRITTVRNGMEREAMCGDREIS